MAIGSSPAGIISSARTTDEWEVEILQKFHKELGEAHRENDALMRCILEFHETHLALSCFSHISNIYWKKSWLWGTDPAYNDKIEKEKAKFSDSSYATSKKPSNITVLTYGNSHLFLVKNSYLERSPWKIEIATSLAQPGDLACWTTEISRALLLRQTQTSRESMREEIGTALFTRDFDLHHEERHATDWTSFKSDEKMDPKVDAATIYVLLA